MKIISYIATLLSRLMPEGMFHPLPGGIATFDDDSNKTLFSFHPDEIFLRASGSMGLTEEEAKSLRYCKDVNHLRS